MDSRLYNSAREDASGGVGLGWVTGIVRAVLLPSSYVPNFDDVYLSAIPSGTRIATSQPITGRTNTGGICAGSPAEFLQLSDTRLVAQAVLFKDTGVDATSKLLYFIGEEDLVTTPFQPLGFDYYIYPSLAEGGYFRV